MHIDILEELLLSELMKDLVSRNKNSPLSPGLIIEAEVDSLNADGFGVSTLEGKPLYMQGTLPGEKIKARITFVGRHQIYASAVRVLRRSKDRLITVRCTKTPDCDSCPLIVMNYHAQLSWKCDHVKHEVSRYTSLKEAMVHDIIPSPQQLGCRYSAKLVIGGKFSKPLIGIYRRNSHDVIDINDCPLHHPLINRVINVVKEGIVKGKVTIYSLRSGRGLLRYLVVRVSAATNQVMVTFVTTERSYNEIHHLAKHLRSHVPEVDVIVQNVNSSSGNVVMGKSDYFLTKKNTIKEQMGEICFNISPRSFFQINTPAARLIYEKVREWGEFNGSETVLDLYCGVGGISLTIAPQVREVIGVEVVEGAVANAESNAVLNNISNCHFRFGSVTDLIKEYSQANTKINLVIINPPRKGCEEDVLRHAALIAPNKIIYVSCSPATMSRDLDILHALGYQTTQIQPVDLFPQTAHVENIAMLVRTNPD
jgi:23S rRNA (uracil1939-C5)-methyltransferase